MRKTAEEYESEFDPETIETIRRNFYVDDCLKSASDTQKTIRLIEQLRDLLIRRSFRLTKFVSNDVTVLASVPESERAESVVNLDLEYSGMYRKISSVFASLAERWPRRGILSDVSSMYDRSGLLHLSFYLPNACCNICAKPKWDGTKRFLRIC